MVTSRTVEQTNMKPLYVARMGGAKYDKNINIVTTKEFQNATSKLDNELHCTSIIIFCIQLFRVPVQPALQQTIDLNNW